MYNANNTSGSYHRYVRKVAGDIVVQSHRLNDGTIPERVFKKIQWYMVEAVIMGEMLARLTDKKITQSDKESLVYLGSIMALFDVFIDDFRFDSSRAENILYNTFSDNSRINSPSDSAIEKIYYLYLEKLLMIIDKDNWNEIHIYLDRIKLQIYSGKQLENKASEHAVNKITIGKGGVSVLIFSAFLGEKDESLKRALFESGGLIQMMNDCQDIHKDTVAGIKTFIHFCNSFTEIFTRMNEHRVSVFKAVMSLELPSERKTAFLFELNAMFVVISYKLHLYARACSYNLDFAAIKAMDRKHFRINPFSLRAIAACAGRILEFDPAESDAIHIFKLDKS